MDINTDRQELEFALAWMKRHAENSLEHREPKGWKRDITGTDGWAVAAIPDWDLRQRISQIEEHLAAPLPER